MVVKIGSSSFLKAFSLSHEKPELFLSAQWTRLAGKSVWFLLFRWILSAFFIGTVAYSWTSSIGKNHFNFWFIYLTNWGLLLCMLSTTLAAVLVTLYHFEVVTIGSQSKHYQVYWLLSNVSTVLAFMISLVYWTVLFNGSTSVVDVLVHGGNSAAMLIELIIVRHPKYFAHFVYPIFVGLVYLIFSIIYYFAGGLDSGGNNFIYTVLKWEEPGKSASVAVGIMILGIFLHIIACVIQKLRHRLHKKVFKVKSLKIDHNISQTV